VGGPITAMNFQDWATGLRRRADDADAPAGGLRFDWMPAARIGIVLAIVAIGLKVAINQYPEYASHFGLPILPVPFLVFAALLLGVFCYAVGPLVAHLDQLFTSWQLLGRLLTLLASITLLILAWPGWLHANWPDEQRAQRVAWTVEKDASL